MLTEFDNKSKDMELKINTVKTMFRANKDLNEDVDILKIYNCKASKTCAYISIKTYKYTTSKQIFPE